MRRSLTAGVMILILLSASLARADVRLAYVDIQRALNECQAGKRAKAKFRTQIETLQAKLQKQQKEVQALKNEIDKKGMLMKADQLQNLQDEYAQKLRHFEQSYKDSRDELQRKDSEITRAIVGDLAYVVRVVGEKDGYTMVMEKGSILWGAPGIDITDQVIKKYDAMHVTPGSLGGKGNSDFGSAAARSYSHQSRPRSTISK